MGEMMNELARCSARNSACSTTPSANRTRTANKVNKVNKANKANKANKVSVVNGASKASKAKASSRARANEASVVSSPDKVKARCRATPLDPWLIGNRLCASGWINCSAA